MKLASFDIEIAKDLSDFEKWHDFAPLGITCAAVALSDSDEVKFWHNGSQLDKNQCVDLVHDLQKLVKDGYHIITWNGAGFDFQVLAQESGLFKECGKLALHHIDMMLLVTFQKGWFLSLQKALEGACLTGKLKKVVLSDGSEIDDMDGSKAPRLWADGEHTAVLEYLREDVVQPLRLAQDILRCGFIRWVSERGNLMEVRTKLVNVLKCFKIPEPDVSWMSDPPKREDFVSWIPNYGKNIKR